MKPGLPIARLLAAMILAIVAWAAPSTGQAHDGHHAAGSHHDHHRAPIAKGAVASSPHGPGVVMQVAVPPTRIAPGEATSVAAAASLLPDDANRTDRAGPDGLCCCGAACCAPGILAAGVTLPGPALGRVRLRPADALARAALGPASLSEPPRPLA